MDWKKFSTVTGYQCQISRSKGFTTNTAQKTYKSSVKMPVKVTGLTSGKTYYVRVRAYKTVSGTKYYGAWSTVKSVKVK